MSSEHQSVPLTFSQITIPTKYVQESFISAQLGDPSEPWPLKGLPGGPKLKIWNQQQKLIQIDVWHAYGQKTFIFDPFEPFWPLLGTQNGQRDFFRKIPQIFVNFCLSPKNLIFGPFWGLNKQRDLFFQRSGSLFRVYGTLTLCKDKSKVPIPRKTPDDWRTDWPSDLFP